MTLGTGCGTAVFHEGRLLPHMELSHAPTGHGGDFDDYVGNAARKRSARRNGTKRVVKAMQIFDEFLFYDKIYVGGGNTKHLSSVDLDRRRRSWPTPPASSAVSASGTWRSRFRR